MKKQIVYEYSDELHDEFSGIIRDTITIDENYQFVHTCPLWKIASFFIYRIVMTPVAYLYLKFKFHACIIGREKLKKSTDGCFLYGNHTNVPADGYIPTVLTFPKKDYVIVNADNVSLKGTRTFMEMIGAFPLPNTIGGMKPFMKAMKQYTKEKNNIVIYPEAHIWPYYIGIRPFTAESFAYPVMMEKPVYCFTTTYQHRAGRKANGRPRMTIYVDGPFLPDTCLKTKTAAQALRDKLYRTMCERSQNSDYEYVKYKKTVKNTEG